MAEKKVVVGCSLSAVAVGPMETARRWASSYVRMVDDGRMQFIRRRLK